MKENDVIFFDGVCGLCNGFVDFVMRIDKKKQFRFSPLQSGFSSQKLPAEYIQNLNSIVVLIDGEIFTKGEAVARVFKKLGGQWSFLSLMRILPSNVLNSGYDLVAANRYRIFGKKDTCRIPSPEERSRFLM
jgi:predicted DCC family thiol-disulfide oxidoreductase YuxK